MGVGRGKVEQPAHFGGRRDRVGGGGHRGRLIWRFIVLSLSVLRNIKRVS